MAQAPGWPTADVKQGKLESGLATGDADGLPGADQLPSQHGAAADKYYQLLSLHGDTVSSTLQLRSSLLWQHLQA